MFKNKSNLIDDWVYSSVYSPPNELYHRQDIFQNCEKYPVSESINNLDLSKVNIVDKNRFEDFTKERPRTFKKLLQHSENKEWNSEKV